MTQQPKDPDRLHLRKLPGVTSYLIIYKRRLIGQVESVPIPTTNGFIDPPILLEQPFSEQLQDRIRDLVNKRDGTNRDIVVRCAPRRDHPAIQNYLMRRVLRW